MILKEQDTEWGKRRKKRSVCVCVCEGGGLRGPLQNSPRTGLCRGDPKGVTWCSDPARAVFPAMESREVAPVLCVFFFFVKWWSASQIGEGLKKTEAQSPDSLLESRCGFPCLSVRSRDSSGTGKRARGCHQWPRLSVWHQSRRNSRISKVWQQETEEGKCRKEKKEHVV